MTKEEIILRLANYGYEVVSTWSKDGAKLLLNMEVRRFYAGINYHGIKTLDVNSTFVCKHINENIRAVETELLNNIYYQMSHDLGAKINPDMAFRFLDVTAKHIDEETTAP